LFIYTARYPQTSTLQTSTSAVQSYADQSNDSPRSEFSCTSSEKLYGFLSTGLQVGGEENE